MEKSMKTKNKKIINILESGRLAVRQSGRHLFILFSLLAIKPFAANQITGTVLDAGTNLPLKNALVSLKSTGDLVLTNESGTFSITKSEVNNRRMKQTVPAAPFTIQRYNLQLTISTPNTPVQLVVLNLNGQVIYKTTKTLQPGSHNFDLTKAITINSTNIVQVKINKTIYTTKILPLAVRPSSGPIVSFSPAVRQSGSLAVSSTDTLLVSKYLYTPQTTAVTATNTISLQKPTTPPPPPGMKAIPEGKFMRGSNRPFSDNDEQPIKEITISPFCIDSTEVTQADYISLLHVEPWLQYKIPAASPFPGSGNMYPVWNINWYDAALYCNARSKRDSLDTVYIYDSISGVAGNGCVLTNIKTEFVKNGYRLATEAEWEYAARSGTTTDYYWGNYTKQDLITPTKYAWYGIDIAHPVAMKTPNDFGLYDMLGNVYEFVNDYYDGNYYVSDEIIDPKGTTFSAAKVLKGGYWSGSLADIRSAARDATAPEIIDEIDGFRVALPNK
jgi:formylglycine-generating enzyme required for sulfatase activity